MKMAKFNDWIKNRRLELNLPLRKVAAFIDIDQSTLSKIERGERLAPLEIIEPLSQVLQVDRKKLKQSYLSEKVVSLIEHNEDAIEILKVAERRIKYQRKTI